jgi:uncharacterized protein YybS (DUF2232 family)
LAQANPTAGTAGLGAEPSSGLAEPGPGSPWWGQLFPFCLSAFFFLSAFLLIFAPLPLIFLYLKKGRFWAWVAALSNGAIVAALGGWMSLVFYTIWILTLALVLPELLNRKKSVELSGFYIILVMLLTAGAFVGGYAFLHHSNPLLELRGEVTSFVDYLAQSVSVNSGLLNPGDADEWKSGLLVEFPSALAIFSLVIIWSNVTLLLRANPRGIREYLGLDAKYLKLWKAPEFLIWPTILSGFFLIFNLGIVSSVALNVFKFLMAIYAIQGLSVLNYFLDFWSIQGFLRMLCYAISLILMMPLLLSLGFFDLWFDFRAKVRQT